MNIQKEYHTLPWFDRVFSMQWLSLPLSNEACLVLDCNGKVLFPESFIQIRANGRRGNFFEEQKALEIIVGCFLDSLTVWAGEDMTEGGRLTHCSNMPL